MRFLYHIDHGAQLFEEDGVDHSEDGWFVHPEDAGLVAVIDPNGPTQWVHPARAPKLEPVPEPEPGSPTQEPVWVQIPADWADLHWKSQCALASQIKGEAVGAKPEAVAIIKAELERRSA